MKNLTHQVIGTLVLSVLIVCIALGGGYQLNEQGARAVGMGGAFVARADDPSAIFFNPAGLASQNGINILAGGNLIIPSTDFTPAASLAPYGLTAKTSTESQVFTPVNLYGSYKLDDKFVVGLGIFNPYGLGTKWPSTVPYSSLKTSLQTWYFNPSVGYKIDDQWSVGLGISYVYGSVKLTTTSESLDGTGGGFNVNIGTIYKLLENLSIGLSYRIKTDIDLSGNFTGPTGTGTGKTTIPMPGSFTLGAAFQLQPDVTVEGDIQYVQWSAYKGLIVTLDHALPHIGSTINADNKPIKWDDAFLLRGGAEYKYSPEVTLRGGLILDLSPQPPSNTDWVLPDGDRFDISLGGSYKIDNNWHVDAAYMLVLFMKRDAQSGTSAAPAPYTGIYNSTAHVISVNVGYTF